MAVKHEGLLSILWPFLFTPPLLLSPGFISQQMGFSLSAVQFVVACSYTENVCNTSRVFSCFNTSGKSRLAHGACRVWSSTEPRYMVFSFIHFLESGLLFCILKVSWWAEYNNIGTHSTSQRETQRYINVFQLSIQLFTFNYIHYYYFFLTSFHLLLMFVSIHI